MNTLCLLRHEAQLLSKSSRKLDQLSTACYIVNRNPSFGINFKTPIELWTGKPVDYSNIRVFGCPAYAHIKQGKLEPRALKGVFLGYPEGVKGYKLWLLECNLCTSFALFTSLNIEVLHLIIVIYLCFTFVGAILLIGDKIKLQDDI